MKTKAKKTTKTVRKTKRKYKSASGPRCSMCGDVGHYRVTCGNKGVVYNPGLGLD